MQPDFEGENMKQN